MSQRQFQVKDRVTSLFHKGEGTVTGTTVDELSMGLMYIVLWDDGYTSAYASTWLELVK